MKSKIITIISILLLVWGAYSLGCQKKEIEEASIELVETDDTQEVSELCCICNKALPEREQLTIVIGDRQWAFCHGCLQEIFEWVIDEYKKTEANK